MAHAAVAAFPNHLFLKPQQQDPNQPKVKQLLEKKALWVTVS